MPTYFAPNISVWLSSMSLADATTPRIVLKKGEIAKKQCEEAEQKLLRSARLREERVLSDSDATGLDFIQLEWLGNAPFMQVQTGNAFEQCRDRDGAKALTQDPNNAQPPAVVDSRFSDYSKHVQSPLALALHVKLSDKTFVSGLDKSNKVHLKIDVFFNGQLSSCMFVPYHDIRSGAKSLHQVFAGYRVDFLSERPWVINSPATIAGSVTSKAKTFSSAQQRWTDICKALRIEASQRGMNKQGDIPPSAEFLHALSSVQMPVQVENLQKPGGKSFGVIDMVITAGEGRKVTSGTTYLKMPMRLTDENFPLKAGQDTTEERDHGDSDYEEEPQPKWRATAPRVLSMASTPHTSLPHLPHHDYGALGATPTPRARQIMPEAFLSFPERGRSGPKEYTHDHSEHIFNGFFSVPTKPKTSCSPSKRSRNDDHERPRSLHIRRLIITGVNGKVLVDHKWSTVQCFVHKEGSNDMKTGFGCPSQGSPANLMGRSVIGASNAKHRSTEHNVPASAHSASFPSSSSSLAYPIPMGTRDELASKKDKPVRQVVGASSQTAKKAVVQTPDLSMPQRRTSYGSRILGVQGPKATTFIFEDPEEVLREGAKLRRSKSPIKYKMEPAATVKPIALTQAGLMREIRTADSSSPLSSLATTPEPDVLSVPATSNSAAIASSRKTPATAIAQTDGPAEHKMMVTPLREVTSSPTKLASSVPRLPLQAPSTPMSSPAPNTKKRKSQGRFLPKQPRSPDRLRTISNPPLNRDCVIAFAESKDGEHEKGVLRQVKGERQGIFAEDYVVFATRFFIPGQ
ncbi:hypothetical protein EK21DRAFT_59689 [Setomelanomma holmii]|uniref:Uncharacterized protein n=1 Tax=Setomelanomma holmii TaxID=210430 RepID=A0A9P4HE54_9PLEO|nr:hypothetical protein EK21DRAFT_59689 [Setomelanomma holmii]